VETGLSDENYAQVLSGLDEGDVVLITREASSSSTDSRDGGFDFGGMSFDMGSMPSGGDMPSGGFPGGGQKPDGELPEGFDGQMPNGEKPELPDGEVPEMPSGERPTPPSGQGSPTDGNAPAGDSTSDTTPTA